jgi:hypothetical protein
VKYKAEKMFTESDRRIIDKATKKAKELNANIAIYDLSSLKGKITAKLKGVDSPTWRVVE